MVKLKGYDNYELAHVWASMRFEDSENRNLRHETSNGNLSTKNGLLFSYNTIIGAFIRNKAGELVCLKSTYNYSITTTGKHYNARNNAIPAYVKTIAFDEIDCFFDSWHNFNPEKIRDVLIKGFNDYFLILNCTDKKYRKKTIENTKTSLENAYNKAQEICKEFGLKKLKSLKSLEFEFVNREKIAAKKTLQNDLNYLFAKTEYFNFNFTKQEFEKAIRYNQLIKPGRMVINALETFIRKLSYMNSENIKNQAIKAIGLPIHIELNDLKNKGDFWDRLNSILIFDEIDQIEYRFRDIEKIVLKVDSIPELNLENLKDCKTQYEDLKRKKDYIYNESEYIFENLNIEDTHHNGNYAAILKSIESKATDIETVLKLAKDSQELKRIEAEKIEAEKAKTRAEYEKGNYSAWQNNELDSIEWDFRTDSTGSDIMRINKDGSQLETARGARVPLDHAIKIFRLVEISKAQNKTFEFKENGPRIGFYRLDLIDPINQIMQAGCHKFSFARIFEVAQIAKDRGLLV